MTSPTLPTRNRFPARVSAIMEAPVLSEIELRLADGPMISATLSTRLIDELGLHVGAPVFAVLRAGSVCLALVEAHAVAAC